MEKRRSWAPSDIQFIKDNYGQLSVHQISSRLSRSYSSITSKIYKLGLDDPRCWTPQEDQLLVENYEFNPTVWELFPTRTSAAVKQRAEKQFRLQRQCGNYRINHKFFDNWSNEMAYVLGFFTADGCVEPNLNRISFSQRKEDVDILEKIRKVMNCWNPLCYKKSRNEVGLYIHNRYMVDKLIELGFDQNKTSTAQIPSNMPDEYALDYIRGLLDGDGSILLPPNYHVYGRIQLLGTKAVLDQVRFYLINQLRVSSKSQPHKRSKVNVYCLNYGAKSDVASICKALYTDANIYMDRKKHYAELVLGAFTRGVSPRTINAAQNEETPPSNVEGNLVGKTGKPDWPVETTCCAPINRMME